MKVAAELQPDQQAARWDNHVAVYEAVFEPLTNVFARHALEYLDLHPGDRLIDVGAGSGGAALIAAEQGAHVLCIDASEKMIARLRQRAAAPPLAGRVEAEVMDGMALALPDASFDAALSVFGVILFPDAARGLREIARVLRPDGRAAIVTWTATERYELVARLQSAIAQIRGPQPPLNTLPAQLRFREEGLFRDLLTDAGLLVRKIVRLEERWRLPSARWLAEHIAFAPGMSAMMAGLAADRGPILEAFVSTLERDQGTGEVVLSAVAHAGIAAKPA
ncbi:MAG TPA: class I SAM-dependent methyltransferase [Xanthobacteraceae bacterium]|nr:class I SAM-dependent methyltransferase [Xanthobacteraceae bacterium]